MAKKLFMSPMTLNTILNTAPVLIQGATRLIKLIRDRGDPAAVEIPDTVEGIKLEVEHLHRRLDADTEANVEQVRLVETLAKQQEALAKQLRATVTYLNLVIIGLLAVAVVAVIALYLTLVA